VTNYQQILEDLGLRQVILVPRAPKKTAARSKARSFMATCVFDKENCALGIDRLENYQRRFIPKLKIFIEEELEDENVHGSDSFICLAEGRDMDTGSGNATAYLAGRKKPSNLAFR